jgi:hypothetical protein
LLERGADVNIKNGKGWTPLFPRGQCAPGTGHGAESGHRPIAMMDVIKVIVDKGADVNAWLKANTEIWRHDLAGRSCATALLRASFCGDRS